MAPAPPGMLAGIPEGVQLILPAQRCPGRMAQVFLKSLILFSTAQGVAGALDPRAGRHLSTRCIPLLPVLSSRGLPSGLCPAAALTPSPAMDEIRTTFSWAKFGMRAPTETLELRVQKLQCPKSHSDHFQKNHLAQQPCREGYHFSFPD